MRCIVALKPRNGTVMVYHDGYQYFTHFVLPFKNIKYWKIGFDKSWLFLDLDLEESDLTYFNSEEIYEKLLEEYPELCL